MISSLKKKGQAEEYTQFGFSLVYILKGTDSVSLHLSGDVQTVPVDAVEIAPVSVTGSMCCSSPCRGSFAPDIAEPPGPSSAGDVGCDVEGGLSEKCQTLWESGGVCVFGI